MDVEAYRAEAKRNQTECFKLMSELKEKKDAVNKTLQTASATITAEQKKEYDLIMLWFDEQISELESMAARFGKLTEYKEQPNILKKNLAGPGRGHIGK